jgi:hypothetical protein
MTYLFGVNKEKRPHSKVVPTTTEDCFEMLQHKRCTHGDMQTIGEVQQTTNKLNAEYPNGGLGCCSWNKFEATNCYMSTSRVIKRHDDDKMYSPAGDTSHCDYEKGHCRLSTGQMLIWKPNRQEKCQYVTWKTIKGTQLDTSWISNNLDLALTFTSGSTVKGCLGQTLHISDQSVMAEINRPRPHRAAPPQIEAGVVSSDLLAAQLQASEFRLQRTINTNFQIATNSICMTMRNTIQALQVALMSNPSATARYMLNNPYLTARLAGNTIFGAPMQPSTGLSTTTIKRNNMHKRYPNKVHFVSP